MSKWGHVSKAGALQKFKDNAERTADQMSEMSSVVLDLEKEVSDLKNQLINSQMSEGMAKSAEAHMRGYIERVRELDPKRKKGKPDA